MHLYNLDWLEFDLKTKKLFYMVLVGATPDRIFKIGNVEVDLESFSKVSFNKKLMPFQLQTYNNKIFLFQFMKVSFSFFAVLQGASSST